MSSHADHNLLFGILALQTDLITRGQLIAGMKAWLLLKDRSLGEVLLEKGHLDRTSYDAIERLVESRIRKNEGDVQKTLSSVRAVSSRVHDDMVALENPDIQASLARVSSTTDDTEVIAGRRTSDGRFAILHLHERGGVGEVFVAKDCELNREVALKQIQASHAHDVSSRTRFLLEAEITGCLEHPGIVPVYGLGYSEDGRPYYAMRFIHGKSLHKQIEEFHNPRGCNHSATEETLEFRKLLRHFIDVCQTVEYAHSRGVIHRDLKPSNVMVGTFGETLVVDWGVAKALGKSEEERAVAVEAAVVPSSGSSATVMGSAIGTPSFMPPEQAAGRLDLVSVASDIYSLGATLYHIIAGRAPFGGEPHEVLKDVRSSSFVRPREVNPKVPPGLEAICLKAMQREPKQRYASAGDLANEVERWLADEPVLAWPDPISIRIKRSIKNHRVLVTGVAATLLVAFVSLAIGLGVVTDKNLQLQETAGRADKNFRQAKGIVDEFLTEVSTSRELLRGTPGTQGLRTRLLENQSLALQGELGAAYFRLAKARDEVGAGDKAADDYQEAIGLLEQAIGQDSESEYRAALVSACTELGNVKRAMGEWAEAESSYQKATTLSDEFLRESPSDPSYQEQLAHACGNLGILYRIMGRLDEASVQTERALEIRQRLVQKHPSVPEYQDKLVADYIQTGSLYTGLGRLDDAERRYLGAIEVGTLLVREHPLSEYVSRLRGGHHGLGSLYEVLARPDEAEEQYSEAVAISEGLVQRNPLVPSYKLSLARTHGKLANLYQEREEHSKAEQQYVSAIEIYRRLASEHRSLSGVYAASAASTYDNLAILYKRMGKPVEAKQQYLNTAKLWDELVALHSSASADKSTLASLYNGRAWYLATAPEEAARSGPQAVEDATSACELTDWNEPAYLDTLAAAYAESGQFEQAVRHQQLAIKLAPESLRAQLQAHLELYQAGKPCRMVAE
jgi:serine/threonine-protein kinase